MTVINTSPNKLIQIGYEGEDKVTILRFSYSDKWLENGEGIFTVRVLRNGENQAYNAQLIEDDRENYTIDMTVTDVELSKNGYGEMQLVYTGADFVKKSSVYKYYVSRSVDDAVDPPEGDVYTQLIESLADLRVDFNELSDMVSEVNDDIGDLTELTTANKLNIVESINEVNAKGFVSVDDELSDISTNPVQNKVITSRIVSVESAIQGKADIHTVTTLSDTVADLQADKADKTYVDDSLTDKVSDVQINGSSIVSNGVANVPISDSSTLGVVRVDTSQGLSVSATGLLAIAQASSNNIRSGTRENNPVTPIRQHESAFYGLAKAAGYDEKSSTLPVGTYSGEAKIAIQKMLGIYEAPWELIREDTFTNAEEADHIITVDADGDAFELSDVILMFETPKQSVEAKKQGYGQFWMHYGDGSLDYFAPACTSWVQSANSEARGVIAFVRQDGGIASFSCTAGATSTNSATLYYRWRTGFDGTAQSVKYTGNPVYINRINIRAVTGTGHYVLYGKRKWQ